jgi:uncharacterized protein (DUF427 family)
VEVDVAWSCRQPFSALAPIAGLVAFYNDRVDTILEGAPIPPAVDLSGASPPKG